MARIWMDGFEHQQVHNNLVVAGNVANLFLTAGRRGYGKCARIAHQSNTINAQGTLSLSLPPSVQRSEVFIRLAAYFGSTQGPTNLQFVNSLNQTIFTMVWPNVNNSNLIINNHSGQQIGQILLPVPAVWLLIQAHVIVANNGSGLIDLRINGSQIVNYSGATSASAALYNGVQFSTFNRSHDFRFDDYAVNDINGSINNSWVADADILGAEVNGQGVYNEWTGSDNDQVNNYLLIKGTGTTLSDYVHSNTVGQRELYTILPDTTVELAEREIIAVQPLFIARKTNADDPAALRPFYRHDSVDYELESPQNLDLNWQYHRGLIMQLAPDQTPWTESKLENLQVGVKKTS